MSAGPDGLGPLVREQVRQVGEQIDDIQVYALGDAHGHGLQVGTFLPRLIGQSAEIHQLSQAGEGKRHKDRQERCHTEGARPRPCPANAGPPTKNEERNPHEVPLLLLNEGRYTQMTAMAVWCAQQRVP
jgi:hypothetical protein